MKRGSTDLSEIVATFFFVGYIPFASGTFGSLAAIPFACIAADHAALGVLMSVALCVIAVPAATRFADRLGEKDPKKVVIDEVCGMTIAAIGIGAAPRRIAAAFLLFRFFDIAKLYPCNRLERIPGGWGILLDDVVAGLYALICAHFLFAFVAA